MDTTFVTAYGSVVGMISGIVGDIVGGKFAGGTAAIPAILVALLPVVTGVGNIETLVENVSDFLNPANEAALNAAFAANWTAVDPSVVDEISSICLAVLQLLVKQKAAAATA